MKLQEVLGDYQAFYADVVRQLDTRGINITGSPISHIAVRSPSIAAYEKVRDALRPHCVSEVEDIRNGRPVNKLLLAEPLQLGDDARVSLIELIPTLSADKYPMGLEHIGFVLGYAYDTFAERHRDALSGLKEHGAYSRPWFVTFANGTSAKFFRYSLKDVIELEGGRFEPYESAAA
ncbi:VOC family protein [Woeseia oceani]|nr:VOC family protein [Woeseia oceani]